MKPKTFRIVKFLAIITAICILAGIAFLGIQNIRDKAKTGAGKTFSKKIQSNLGSEAVGIWSFNEGKDSSVADSSGRGNNGTWYGTGAHWTNEGITKAAGQFNGTNDYVDCGTGESLDITGPLTVEAWINKKTDSYYSPVVGKYANSLAWVLRANGNNKDIGTRIYQTDTVFDELYTGEALNLDTWYHLALIFTPNDSIDIYVNGIKKATKLTNLSSIQSIPTISVRIGGDYANYFSGAIDEVKIYKQALGAAEIQKHYAEGLRKRLVKS